MVVGKKHVYLKTNNTTRVDSLAQLNPPSSLEGGGLSSLAPEWVWLN
jgi:hypothetical protein